MNFVNETKFNADWTVGFDRDGREIVIVAIKATYLISSDGEEVLAPEQQPLTKSDEFTGEPGLSAPLYETDYSHYKPNCDVLVNGSAYAPHNRATTRVTVGVKVGAVKKSFDVVGERRWYDGTLGMRVTQAEPFQVMPISYDGAYGGTDAQPENPDQIKTYLPNPVGRGYYPVAKNLDGKPLPITEESGKPATDINGGYRPMSLGPIGRSWPTRAKHAGTYDKEWLDNHAPFWPEDFDYRYFQTAPEDQQIEYPRGEDEVTLLNLTPEGFTRFRLPKVDVPVLLIPYDGDDRWVDAAADTLLIEPDHRRFMLTCRAIFPLRRDVFEIDEMIVGKPRRQRRLELRADKPYYRGLAELAKARKARGY